MLQPFLSFLDVSRSFAGQMRDERWVEGRPRHGTRDYEAELRLHNAASYWPSWSSDGTLIVYTRFVFAPTGQPDELFTMRPDGTGNAPLVRSPGHAENEADRGVHP